MCRWLAPASYSDRIARTKKEREREPTFLIQVGKYSTIEVCGGKHVQTISQQ